MEIRNFEEMLSYLAKQGERRRVAVVWAADHNSQVSVQRALEAGFIDAIFVGCQKEVEQNEDVMRYADHVFFEPATDADDAAKRAVQMVHEGKVDVLMKGLINTDNLLHVVLNKETGILPRGRVLTHITAAELPGYDKLLFFTDSAVIPYPTHEQRIEQVRYMADLCHKMGIEEPRIALNHCTEKPNEKYFPFTLGYREIIEMGKKGDFGTINLAYGGTVNKLLIDGAELDAGTYGATGSGAANIRDDIFTGTGVLTVTAGEGGDEPPVVVTNPLVIYFE